MILLIAYDLHNPGRDYDKIAKVIESANSHVHPQGSVWLVDSSRAPNEWRDALRDAGDPNDEHFVVRLRQNWASSHLDKDATAWLKDPARSW